MSLSETDHAIKQSHLEIPAFQMFLERTARRMKEMNVERRQDAHTISVLKQKCEQRAQLRSAEQELEECEARLNSVRIESLAESVEKIAQESFSSDDGSIGDAEEVGINKSVLKRETSPVGYTGRSQSPRATLEQRAFYERSRKISMFSGQ